MEREFSRRTLGKATLAFGLSAIFGQSCVADYSVGQQTPENDPDSYNLKMAIQKKAFEVQEREFERKANELPQLNLCLEYPAYGPISSFFKSSHPLGIDIDGYQDPNQDIKAALSGRVVFAGGEPAVSYGYFAVLEHSDSIFTLYAHMKKLDVKIGDEVETNQSLGIMGRTGRSTGNHLHFEVRSLKDETKLSSLAGNFSDNDFWINENDNFLFHNPLNYLKSGQESKC